MKRRVVVLGAGFGGLELTTILSDAFGDAIDIVLVDRNDAFVFGFSKLDVMFGRQAPAAIRHSYSGIVKPGVRFVQTTVRSIDPAGTPNRHRRGHIRRGLPRHRARSGTTTLARLPGWRREATSST